MIDITVKAEFLFELASKNEWVRRCPECLPKKIRAGETWIWIDKNGFVFEKGEDFMVAETIDSYPCKVYRTINVASQKNGKDN